MEVKLRTPTLISLKILTEIDYMRGYALNLILIFLLIQRPLSWAISVGLGVGGMGESWSYIWFQLNNAGRLSHTILRFCFPDLNYWLYICYLGIKKMCQDILTILNLAIAIERLL